MKINTDFSLRVCLSHHELPWLDSPASGVCRRLLERDGTEVARATSVVRYQAGTRFPRHVHDLGEEILVLDGVFSDEQGDHRAGTYLKNPRAPRMHRHLLMAARCWSSFVISIPGTGNRFAWTCSAARGSPGW